MDQDQNNNAEVENTKNIEGVEEVSVGTSAVQNPHKSTYFTAGGIVLGCLILAAAYVYIQTVDVEREISIDVPADVEENEYFQTSNASTSLDAEESVDGKEFIHTLSNDPAKYDLYYKELISQSGVAWQEHPTPVGDLKLFSVTEEYQLKDKKIQYYQIATVDSKSLYVAFVPYCEMGCTNSMLYFIKDNPQIYTYLEAQSTNELTSDYFGFSLANNVKIDKDFVLVAHQIPEKLTIGGVEFTVQQGVSFNWGPTFFADTYYNTAKRDEGQITEFLAETKYGPVFRGLRDMSGGKTQDLDYAIRLAGGLIVTLNYKPNFIGDDRVPMIRWLDGTTNENAYRTDGLGSCGGGGPEVMKELILMTSLQLAGYTFNQEPIYRVIDSNQYVITRLFTEGDIRSYYEYNQITKTTEKKEISKDDFIKENGVILYVDKFGFQHVLTHTKYGPQAECGKPVVYLYPEETTDVTVKLDALVTVSDPVYGSGWEVTASPEGALTTNGKVYDSLFWDGYGNGEYPKLTEGFVVGTENAIPLMQEHLKTMGFNEKEIADFTEFWEPHMPKEPYTRFSWIGTAGMENLAKIDINPKPDTLIRAFIDFDGLEELIEIKPQTIPHYERNGFVATEWGGLLKR